MKRMEMLWNILYYCTYTLLYRCFCAVNPLRLIDNKYTRKFRKQENHAWKALDMIRREEEREKDFSPFLLVEALGGTCIFALLAMIAILNVAIAITHIPLYGLIYRDVAGMILSLGLVALLLYVFNYVFLFRNKRYVFYFKQFRKKGQARHWIYFALSYISVAVACYLSFILI